MITKIQTLESIIRAAQESSKRTGRSVHTELCNAILHAKTDTERRDISNAIRRYVH